MPNLVITTALNAKINEVKGEIASITGLASTTVLMMLKIIYQMLVLLAKKLTMT